jgi:S-adenosylmethionine/arginine decarboxylase-like enzyme
MNEPWGYQLIINAKNCNDLLKGKESILKFNDYLIQSIDMEKAGDAVLKYFDELGDKNGWTLFQMISTSSITIHFCDNGKAFFDIFSCKYFDPNVACDIVTKFFGTTDIKWNFIERDI